LYNQFCHAIWHLERVKPIKSIHIKKYMLTTYAHIFMFYV
jgi:hypothetical protein